MTVVAKIVRKESRATLQRMRRKIVNNQNITSSLNSLCVSKATEREKRLSQDRGLSIYSIPAFKHLQPAKIKSDAASEESASDISSVE